MLRKAEISRTAALARGFSRAFAVIGCVLLVFTL